MSKSFIKQFGSELTEDGLQIVWEAHLEDWSHVTELDDPELETKVELGELMLFAVRAVVRACGVELGDDWMGGCIYAQFEHFLDEGGYADDMRDSLRRIARLRLAELADLRDSIERSN